MRTNRSTVLVTGGLGYIGSYTVPELVERGWRVRILDNNYRSDPQVAEDLAKLEGVEIIEGDVRYPAAVMQAMRGSEAVVHLAAICLNKSISDPTESSDVNLMGTQNVLEAAAAHGVNRFVFASSASVYGNPTSLPMTEADKLEPITPYCIAKLASEQLLSFYGTRTGMSWAALRFFNVYGPGQPVDAYYTSVIVSFLRRLMAGEAPVIDGSGEQSMDFVYVSDVARSVAMALDSSSNGMVFNVGTGQQTSIKQLALLLIDALGVDLEPTFRPREVLVSQREASIDLIGEHLGWKPEVGIEEGLATVVDWVKNMPHADSPR